MKHKYVSNSPVFALVTGASRGLGKDIASELALRNYNLLLVSLKNEGLPEFCSDISRRYKIKAEYFETDLSESQSVFKVAEWALSKGHICILVNNAGTGGTMSFGDATVEYIDGIIQLNIRATSLLTRLLLPELKTHHRSYILNVASTASFSPIAYKTVYPASKAFIWSFSKGLSEELKNTGVHVSVVHPGPMRTNADVIMRIENQGMLGRLAVMTSRNTARIAVNRLFNGNRIIIPGLFNKFNWLLSRLVPLQIRLTVVSRAMKRDLKTYAYR